MEIGGFFYHQVHLKERERESEWDVDQYVCVYIYIYILCGYVNVSINVYVQPVPSSETYTNADKPLGPNSSLGLAPLV